MKLGALRDGSRDGRLVVLSRDLARAALATGIAPTLQAALDGWDVTAPKLAALFDRFEGGMVPEEIRLDPGALGPPLPRAFGWIDSSVYLSHMERARKLRNAPFPEIYRREPLMSVRMPGPFLAAHDPIELPPGDVGLDIEGEIAVIVDDVPQGTPREAAGAHIKLVTLMNDVSLRTVFAREAADGKTSYHGKTAGVLAPAVVTPDELGDAWDGGKLSLKLHCRIGDRSLGQPDAGIDMSFDFRDLVSHASRSRPLGAGTLIASGTVSNRDAGAGTACIAETRMLETIDFGAPRTAYLATGDTLHIEMLDRAGRSVFGAISQRVVATRKDGP